MEGQFMTTMPGRRAPAARPIRARRKPGFWALEFYDSALGKKAVMAVTGIIGLGFVLMHMIGNLKIYTGENAAGIAHLTEYGEYLRAFGEPILPHTGFLWIMRAVLILAVILHVHAAVTLTRLNQKARPTGYKGGRGHANSNYYAAWSMRITGVLVLAFLVFHLFDLTWG